MEFFKSGLKSVLGSQESQEEPSGAETVERLLERVQSSTLLEDRRDACRALKALSRKYRIEVGAQGLDILTNVLETDRSDSEIVGYALDTLCNITAPQVFEEEERPELSHEPLAHVGEQFTEIFLKNPENVSTVLSFLEEYDFKVRWPALKLLSSLLSNRLRDIQEIILVSPMGVSKLMDLLGDSREVIRNDTLLLLAQLTKGNANIQKIVAFENAFDRLFSVIQEEGYSDGGIVVEDCLLLMLNLLRNNISNQNFFKEGSYIQKLIPLFNIPPENEENLWSPQKVSNIDGVLQVVRCLVSPGNPGQVTSGCQKVLRSTGILVQMCNILMASGVPVDVLIEAICAVGETVRGNQPNQEFFASFMAPSIPPREALVVLLMSMVNEKQPFSLRCAVLYCFQCYLYKNEVGQAQVVQTLLPSTTEVTSVTCGQLLCSGLFSHDPLSTWLSSVALSHCLIENPQQKEQLLRVLLAPAPQSQPITLLQQLVSLLHQCSKTQSKIGLLIALCTWMSHCSLSIKHFLSIQSSIPYLISQAGSNERDDNEELLQGMCAFLLGICILFNDDSVQDYSKESLKQLVLKRVGYETFLSKLSEVSRHEQYSKTVKQPQPSRTNTPPDILLDYEFCKLFKALEGMIQKAVSSEDTELSSEGLLSRYKEVIREQDRKLKESETLRHESETAKLNVEYRLSQADALIARLNDENAILRAQVSAGPVGGVQIQMPGQNPQPDKTVYINEIDRLNNLLVSKDNHILRLEEDIRQLHSQIQAQAAAHASQLSNNEQLNGPSSDVKEELAKLQNDQDDLLELLADQENKIAAFKKRLKELGEEVDDEDSEAEDAIEPQVIEQSKPQTLSSYMPQVL